MSSHFGISGGSYRFHKDVYVYLLPKTGVGINLARGPL